MGAPTQPPGTPPAQPPLDYAAVFRLVEERVQKDRDYLKFAQDQAEKDRKDFKHIFDRTVWFLAFLIVAVGLFGIHSVNQLRDEVSGSVKAEMQKAHIEVQAMTNSVQATTEDLKATSKRELDNVRVEVKKRVDDEFKSDNITALVRDAAKERTEKELAGIIRSETSTQVAKGIQEQGPVIQKAVEDQTRKAVKSLEPTISSTVAKEMESQVQKSVRPIEEKMKSYGEVIAVERLVILAKNNDRRAFDQLLAIMSMPPNGRSDDIRQIADATVRDVVSQNKTSLRMGLKFIQPQTPEAIKALAKSQIAEERLAALDNYPQNDNSLLPLLIDMIQNDDNLMVVETAMRRFDAETKQTFQFPDYAAFIGYWNNNRATLEQKPKP